MLQAKHLREWRLVHNAMLHKTSLNATVESRVPTEDRHHLHCPDVGDALARHAWLPRHQRATGGFMRFRRSADSIHNSQPIYICKTPRRINSHFFSPLYAWFIGLLGLENAARLLTVFFTVWFLAAAWSFSRDIAGRDAAWLAVAFLLIIAGDYGASGVSGF